MAKQFPALDQAKRDFILRQHIFFTASATADSRINISPREIGALRILGDNTVAYLDRTGSGNETAAHMLADGRLTIMFCAVEGPPQIMRLYGRGTSVPWDSEAFTRIIADHYAGAAPLGTRQIMRLDFDLVQTSCGYGVPLFDYAGERASMENWHDNKGPDGIRDYWDRENRTSMDGLPTGLTVPDA
ncbi:pyridoxamine 5'-phosphate oxidase family protein [uncultured Tateyamaria sp.]|uniref:pyridoxamine 5'-phosphate oxidase family protein n=1 Tax=uncultured Tateyamaria sp. TaxID=455651 RepID=UPI00260A8C4B|nr:pyridoxamine 5'-phosphate oxidase family protein [uncultured Tateyamaria sp.]